MVFVIGCHPVLTSSAARSWTNHNSAAVFLVRCNGYLRLPAHRKTVISRESLSQLHYEKCTDGNRKLHLLTHCCGTEKLRCQNVQESLTGKIEQSVEYVDALLIVLNELVGIQRPNLRPNDTSSNKHTHPSGNGTVHINNVRNFNSSLFSTKMDDDICLYRLGVACHSGQFRLLPSALHHHNHFTVLFPGPPGWASARRELLDFMVQGKTNRGKHIDHPARRHSVRTNQFPPPPSHVLQAGCPSCHPTNSVKALKTTSAFGLGRRR